MPPSLPGPVGGQEEPSRVCAMALMASWQEGGMQARAALRLDHHRTLALTSPWKGSPLGGGPTSSHFRDKTMQIREVQKLALPVRWPATPFTGNTQLKHE